MRILIVEDEKKIANMVKAGLESEGFCIDVAEDGERGSFLARTNDYDLIILDNLLPQKAGLQVCLEIRQAGKTIPILMLSVKSRPEEKTELLNAGADDYLSKPFSFCELLARIRALLRRPNRIEGEVLNFDSLIMDTRKHQVWRNKREIYLTRKEFSLLEYLIRNLETVLSRGMILEHVWDMNVDPFSNTIEAHILSLRKKLNLAGCKKLIKTVPGIGYKMS